MISFVTTRCRSIARAGSLFLIASSLSSYAQGHRTGPPPSPSAQPQAGARPQQPKGQRGEHLAQWMERHRNLSPQEQQKALRSEPGFNSLPSEMQSRYINRLQQLNSMPPERREKFLNRAEAFERMEPQQRQQVRGALGQLGMLPQDRRRVVARAFRDLRAIPPDQRGAALGSEAYRGFSEQERATLNNLLRVEPYMPQDRPGAQPPAGGAPSAPPR